MTSSLLITSGAHVSEKNLASLSVDNACLSDICLNNSSVSNSVFYDVTMSDLTLTNVNLKNVTFDRTSLSDMVLLNVSLKSIKMSSVTLRNIVLKNCWLDGEETNKIITFEVIPPEKSQQFASKNTNKNIHGIGKTDYKIFIIGLSGIAAACYLIRNFIQ